MGPHRTAPWDRPARRYVLSVYMLNGTWLGFRQMTTQFQLCGAVSSDAQQWRRYGARLRRRLRRRRLRLPLRLRASARF